jgi:hypothetical protein
LFYRNCYVVSGDQRRVAINASSELESHVEVSKLMQSQQDGVSRISAEEVSWQGSKWQTVATGIKEMSRTDGIKYTTFHDYCSNNKGKDNVIESAFVEKTLEEDKKLSKCLLSKEKCRMNQTVHCNTLACEVKKYLKSVVNYPGGVRRTSPQYYTTIDEYFGKDFIKTKDEIKHAAEDSAKNLVKNEFTSNNSQQLVCESKFPVISRKLEQSHEVIRTKNLQTETVTVLELSDEVIRTKKLSTDTVILPVELKEKLLKVSTSPHTSKSPKSVKRRSSESCGSLSKTHKKRRYSYGGEEAVVFGISVQKREKMRCVRNEMKTWKNEVKILEVEIPQLSKTGEQAAAHGLSTGNVTKMKPRTNEMMQTRMNEEKMLGKESTQYLKTGKDTATQGTSIERARKTKLGGSKIVKNRENKEKVSEEESQHCLNTDVHDSVQGTSAEKAIKVKHGRSESLQTGKNEKKMLKKTPWCSKTEQQCPAQSISTKKARKTKPGGNKTVKNRKNKEKVLEDESQQCLNTGEQDSVQGVSTEGATKVKPGGSEMAKNGKKILKKTLCCLKPEQQPPVQNVSTKEDTKTKPGGNKIVKNRKNEEKVLGEESQQCLNTDEQAAVQDVSTEKTTEIKPRGSEMVKSGGKNKVTVLGKERQQHSFESLSNCEKNKNYVSSKKQNRRSTIEDISNRIPSHTSNDLKFSKYKKRKMMLELFGEDSDEFSSKNSDCPDGVGITFLREKNTCAIPSKVSDLSEENIVFAGTSELDNRQNNVGSTCHPSFIGGAVRQSAQQKTKVFEFCQSSFSSHKSEVQNVGSLICSVQGNNPQKDYICSTREDRANAATVQQKNDQQSTSVSNKNDLLALAPRTVAVHADALGESDCHKDTEARGCETVVPITSPMKDRTDADTVAQNNEFGHQQSSVVAHKSDIHLTGSIKEGENGEFHLIINVGNLDTLFPSSKAGNSGTTMKLLSVNYNIAKDINDALDGHSTNISQVAPAEECTENAVVSLDSVESVAEKVVASEESSSIPDTIKVPTLCREVTGTENKQHEQGNEYRTVQMSPLQDVVLLGRGVQDSASQSQSFISSAALTKETEVTPKVAEIHAENASSQTSYDEGSKETEAEKGKTDKTIGQDGDIQGEGYIVGKKKCLPESKSNHNQSSVALQKNISNSGENSPLDGCRPSANSDQLRNDQSGHNLAANPSESESFPQNTRNTNDTIPHVMDVPVSYTLPRIRVRDPESLGITQHEKSFFEVMDKKLRELTEVTYVLLQDMTRSKQRYEALSPLTGTLKDTETALAMAEILSPHQIVKAKAFLDLYKDIETRFSKETEEFLIKRLSDLNPGSTYTSNQLKMCQKYCIWVMHSQKNHENLVCTSGQATSSIPFPQQVIEQHHQQQPVRVSISNPVTWNMNNQVLSLSHTSSTQAGGQIPLNSQAHTSSEQHTSESVENISVVQIQHTSGGKEMVTHNGSSVTKPTSYDMHMRGVGTNLNARCAQIQNIPQQQFHNDHNPLQSQNSSSRQFQTYSHSSPYVLPSVPTTHRSILLAQGQALVNRPENRTVLKLLPCNCSVQNTVQSSIHPGSNSVVAGFTGPVPVSVSSYSRPNASSHSYHQGAPSCNSSNSLYPQNQYIQQGTLSHHSSDDILQNTRPTRVLFLSNQGSQQGSFFHMSNDAGLNRSAPNSSSWPYPQNEPVQQSTLSQSVSNTLPNISIPNSSSRPCPQNAIQQGTFSHPASSTVPNISAPNSSSQPYPRNEAVRQGKFSQSVGNTLPNISIPNSSSRPCPPNAVQQGMLSHPPSSTFPKVLAPNSSSQSHPQNETKQQGKFSQSVDNTLPDVPISNLTSQSHPNAIQQSTFSPCVDNVAVPNTTPYSSSHPYLSNQPLPQEMFPNCLHNDTPSVLTESAQEKISLRGMLLTSPAVPTGQNHWGYVHEAQNPFNVPPSNLAVGSSCTQPLTQMMPQAQQQVSVQEHHVTAGQGNMRPYSGVLSGFPEKHQAPLVVSGSELQSCGALQPISHRQGSCGIRNVNITRSNNLSGRMIQNTPASNSFFERGNDQIGSLGNSMARNSLCDMEGNQSISLGNGMASNSLSDGRNTQSVPASNFLCGRRNSQGGSFLYSAASNSLSDRISNQSGSVTHSTASNSLSDRISNQSGSLTHSTTSNSVSDRISNQSGSLTHSTASNSLSDRISNQSGSLTHSTVSNSVSVRISNQSGSLTHSTASNSVSDRISNQSGILTHSTASKSLSDRISNQSGSLSHNTVSNSVSDRIHNQSGSLTHSTSNSVSNRISNRSGCLTHSTASNSLSDRIRNKSGSLTQSTSNDVSHRISNHSGSLTHNTSNSVSDRINKQSRSLTYSIASNSQSEKICNQNGSLTHSTASISVFHRIRNQSRSLTHSTASNSLSDRISNQSGCVTHSTASNSVSNRISNRSGSPTHSTAGNSLSERISNQSGSLSHNTASNSLSERISNQSGCVTHSTASISVSDRINNQIGCFTHSTASNSLFDKISNQSGSLIHSTASNSLSERISNQSGSLTHSTASNSLSDRISNQSGSLTHSTASNSVSDRISNQSGCVTHSTASNSVSDRISNQSGSPTHSTAGNSLSERISNQSGSLTHSTASNGLYEKISNQSGSLTHSTANNSLSDRISNQSGSLTHSTASNSLSDRISNQSGSLTHSTVSNSVSDRISNQSGSLTHSTASNSVSDRISNQSGILTHSTASKSPSDRISNQSGSLSHSTVSNSVSDRIHNQSGSLTHSTASNGLSERISNHIGSLTHSTASNSLSDTINNQNGSLTNSTAINSISDRRNNQSGSLTNSTASNSHSDRRNNKGQLPVIDFPTSVQFQAGMNGVTQQSSKSTQDLFISEVGQQNMKNVTQNLLPGAHPLTENQSVNGVHGLFSGSTGSETSHHRNSQLGINPNVTESPASLQNSQPLFHGNQQFSSNRSSQRQVSNIVTADHPLLPGSIPIVTVQASVNKSHDPAVLRQATGMLSTSHSLQTSHHRLYQTSSTHLMTHSAMVGEPPESTLPGHKSTYNTLEIEACQNTSDRLTMQTFWRTSNYKPRNQPDILEVDDSGSNKQVQTVSECLGTEVDGLEGTQVVANACEKQDKCDMSNRVPEKHTAYNCSSDPKSGFASIMRRKERELETAEVTSKQSEQSEVTIFTVEKCVPVSTSESCHTTSKLNKISTDGAEKEGVSGYENRESNTEVGMVSSICLL